MCHHWRLLVRVDPRLDTHIQRISQTCLFRRDHVREDMKRVKTDACSKEGVYESPQVHKMWGLCQVKV